MAKSGLRKGFETKNLLMTSTPRRMCPHRPMARSQVEPAVQHQGFEKASKFDVDAFSGLSLKSASLQERLVTVVAIAVAATSKGYRQEQTTCLNTTSCA